MSVKKARSTTNQEIGYQRWKQIKDAGTRWIAEIVFASIKRVHSLHRCNRNYLIEL